MHPMIRSVRLAFPRPGRPLGRLHARVWAAQDAVVIARTLSELRRHRPEVFAGLLDYMPARFDDLVAHFDLAASRAVAR